jgi:hypothetical protein
LVDAFIIIIPPLLIIIIISKQPTHLLENRRHARPEGHPRLLHVHLLRLRLLCLLL